MVKNIELEHLVINKLTQEQYDALAVKNPGELYFITDANPTKEVETQLAELSEKVPEPISTYESFPEATAENAGMRVVYTGETIEAPYVENEDGSVSTVFLDPYLTRGHTFMLVPVQVLTSDTESITIYMWQDVIGAIPPFDYDMAGQVLSTNGMGYEWTELPEAGLTKEEADQTYLPLSGGTLTGDLEIIKDTDDAQIILGYPGYGGTPFGCKIKVYSDGFTITDRQYGGMGIATFSSYSGLNIERNLDIGRFGAPKDIYLTGALKKNDQTFELPTTGGTMVVATPPNDNGTYVLKANVADGVVTTEWVLEV